MNEKLEKKDIEELLEIHNKFVLKITEKLDKKIEKDGHKISLVNLYNSSYEQLKLLNYFVKSFNFMKKKEGKNE